MESSRIISPDRMSDTGVYVQTTGMWNICQRAQSLCQKEFISVTHSTDVCIVLSNPVSQDWTHLGI